MRALWQILGLVVYFVACALGVATGLAALDTASYLVLARGALVVVFLVVLSIFCFEKGRP